MTLECLMAVVNIECLMCVMTIQYAVTAVKTECLVSV